MYDIKRLKNSFENDEMFVGSRNQIERLLQFIIDNHPEIKIDSHLSNTSSVDTIINESTPHFQEAYDISGRISVRFIYDELYLGPTYAAGFDAKPFSELEV